MARIAQMTPRTRPQAFSEADRMAAVRSLELLDTPPESDFDDLVQLAADLCSVPISSFTLIDEDRAWIKASTGVEVKESPRELSICSWTVQQNSFFEVPDTSKDPRFRANPFVNADPGIRFYAGLPLRTPDQLPVGTLCVVDTKPRSLTERQRSGLATLARQIETLLALRVEQRRNRETLAENDRLSRRLLYSNESFRAFMNNGPFISFIKDKDGRLLFYNKNFAKHFGVTSEEWLERTDFDNFPEEMASTIRERDLQVISGGAPVEFAEAFAEPNGKTVHWRTIKFPFLHETGEQMLAGMSVDVSEEIAREAELERLLQHKGELARGLQSVELLLHTLAENSPNHISFKSGEGRYIFYNRAFAKYRGIDQKAWIGKTDHDLLPKKLADRVHKEELAILKGNSMQESVDQIKGPENQRLTFKSTRLCIEDAEGQRLLATVAMDVTEASAREEALAAANAQLEKLAATDALTGLPNRRVFEERLSSAFSVAHRNNRPLTVLLMDIDNFKKRNDTYGHAAGDEALRLLGGVLLQSVRSGDIPARVGGEEFGFLLPETDSAGALIVANRLQTRLRKVDAGPPPLTVSIGIASLSPTTPNWERLLARADDAMYAAKRAGKDRAVVHHQHISQLANALQEELAVREAEPPAVSA